MKKLILATFIIGLTLSVTPYIASADTSDERQQKISDLRDIVEELQLRLLEKKGIPALVKAVPQEAEIGEVVVIHGKRFDEHVDVLFDKYVVVENLEVVNENLIAFSIPESFSYPESCSTTSQGRVCARPMIAVIPQFETYDVRVKTSKGTSNIVKLKIVREK